MRYDFENRVAIVTGGTRGIGRAIVEALLESNARVIATYLKNDFEASQFRDSLSPREKKLVVVRHDVSDLADSKRLIQMGMDLFDETPTLLVNNAGTLTPECFLNLSSTQWLETFATNLVGPFKLTQEFMRQFKKSQATDTATIVNVASVGGQVGGNKATDYATSKAALISFTKSIARIGASLGVRCNAVAPGWIETDIFSDSELESLKNDVRGVVPIGRLGQAREVASPVLFLLSDGSSYVTGHCLNINGGMYLG